MGEVKKDVVVDTAKSVLLPGMKEAFGPLPAGVLPEPPKAVEEKLPEKVKPPVWEMDRYGHPKPKKWPEDY